MKDIWQFGISIALFISSSISVFYFFRKKMGKKIKFLTAIRVINIFLPIMILGGVVYGNQNSFVKSSAFIVALVFFAFISISLWVHIYLYDRRAPYTPPEVSADIRAKVQARLGSTGKISAIKLYRELSGARAVDAKKYIEWLVLMDKAALQRETAGYV